MISLFNVIDIVNKKISNISSIHTYIFNSELNYKNIIIIIID